MIPNFQTLLKTQGAGLLDPLGFGKYKNQRLHETPELYWKTFCSRNGVDFTQVLSKIDEAKRELARVEERPQRYALNPDYLRRDFVINGQTFNLLNWQKEFNTKFKATKYALLSAGIGTGKTWAISEMIRLRWLKDYDKVLILCPKSVFSSWSESIKEYYGGKAKSITITGSGKKKLDLLNFKRHFYITNYESLKQDAVREKLKEMGFTWIVADEAHKFLCNPSTQNFKYAIEVSASIEMRYILTGTPRKSKDENLYGLVTFLDRGLRFGASFYKFKEKYFSPEYDYPGSQFASGYHLRPEMEREFYDKINSIMFHVNKRDVLKDLPPLIHEIRQIELTGDALRNYKVMQKESVIEIDKYCNLTDTNKKFSVEAGVVIARLTKLRQICSGFVRETEAEETIDFNKDKLTELKNIMEEVDEPVIVTCVYTQEIIDIENLCKEMGLSYGVISGKKSDKFRNESKELFSHGKLDVMILQEEAGGAGINGLQNHCSLMIEYSFSYSFDTWDQKIGRMERQGQKNKMRLITFEAVLDKGQTIDRAMIETIKNKRDGSEYLIENLRRLNG